MADCSLSRSEEEQILVSNLVVHLTWAGLVFLFDTGSQEAQAGLEFIL